jgi:hypothetical protein
MTDDLDNIWTDGGADDLANTPSRATDPTGRAGAFFGCPLWWIQRVAPLVHSKSEVLAAIYLWRLRAICRRKTVVLANSRLLLDLGVSRWSKYRMLEHLERGNLIKVVRRGKAAPRVTFNR